MPQIAGTGAVGKPLGSPVSGFTIARVEGQKLEPKWYSLARVSNAIGPDEPLPESDEPQKF